MMASANQVEKLYQDSGNFGESGETEHPLTLQEICFNYICNNLNEICVIKNVVVTPKRRRISSGILPSYVDVVDFGSSHSSLNSAAYSHSKDNETPVERVVNPTLICPNVKSILPGASEDIFEADSPRNRPDWCTEGRSKGYCPTIIVILLLLLPLSK